MDHRKNTPPSQLLNSGIKHRAVGTSLHTLEAVLNTSIRTHEAVPQTLLICRNTGSLASAVLAHTVHDFTEALCSATAY